MNRRWTTTAAIRIEINKKADQFNSYFTNIALCSLAPNNRAVWPRASCTIESILCVTFLNVSFFLSAVNWHSIFRNRQQSAHTHRRAELFNGVFFLPSYVCRSQIKWNTEKINDFSFIYFRVLCSRGTNSIAVLHWMCMGGKTASELRSRDTRFILFDIDCMNIKRVDDYRFFFRQFCFWNKNVKGSTRFVCGAKSLCHTQRPNSIDFRGEK